MKLPAHLRRFALGLLPWLTIPVLAAAPKPAARPPNLIFIMADDLGYGDLGCYGQTKIKTPHLDQLAADGIRFTSAYAGAPVCAPARCVLLTGRHTGHARVRGNLPSDRPRNPLAVALQPDDLTLAKVLKPAGYTSAAIGKWGLGNPGPEATGLPLRQGFDYFFGYVNQTHAHNSYPTFLWRNEEKVALPNLVPDEGPLGTGVSSNMAVHSQDLFIAEALKFIRAERARPFFLYFALTLPHANDESEPLGLEIPSLGEYADRDWPEAAKRYAAMVTRIDTDVGRVLALLDELNLADDTIVVFTSDNGPHHEGGNDPAFFTSSGPFRGMKRDLYEGGIREPMIVRWPGHAPAGRTDDTPWYFADVLPTFADLAGQPPPPTDGVSVRPLWEGHAQPALADRPLYWEFYEGGFHQAARRGPWKIVQPKAGAPFELYDLRTDPGETHDLAAAQPAVLGSLKDVLRTSHTDSPAWPAPPPK